MKFVILEPEAFQKYAEKSPYKSFYQTLEIAKLREKAGWTPYYFGVEENQKIVAATMLIAKPSFLGKSTYFAPGGPLLDFENTALVNFFVKHLKTYIKSHNGYILNIDPNYELIERNRSGEAVEAGYNHQKALKNLIKLGFKPTNSTQPKYHFVMEIKNRTPEEIMADFKRNTRNHVRKAEKQGVTIRELKKEELSEFKKITESTSKRRHFEDKSLNYYEQMYDLFHEKGEVKFIVAEVKPESSKKEDPIIISAAMFILYGDEIIYLFSGSDEKYMREYNAQYLIQWHMIKYAAEHGFKRYNFYGINGLPDSSSKDYGIYDFKKGFTSEQTGRVIELLGAYKLPVNKPFYYLHELLSKIKHH